MSGQHPTPSRRRSGATDSFAERLVAMCRRHDALGKPRFTETQIESFFLVVSALAGTEELSDLSPRLLQRLQLVNKKADALEVPTELLEGLVTILQELSPSTAEMASKSLRFLGTDQRSQPATEANGGERLSLVSVRISTTR